MPEAVPILTAVSSILGGAASLKQAFGSSGGGGMPQPPAPPTDKTSFDSPNPVDAPAFLQMSSQMTPTQQLSQLATLGTSGNDPRYRDPASQQYFGNLLQRQWIDPASGGIREGTTVNPAYARYISEVMGQPIINADDPASLLSAILRG